MAATSSSLTRSVRRLCAIAGFLSIVALGGCGTTPEETPKPSVPVQPPAPHQITAELPNFLRLPNQPAAQVPVRVGVILPFANQSPSVRALAAGMMHAAEMALFDSRNTNIILMAAEDNGSPVEAAAAAQKLLDQGAEIIVGPIFSASVAAVAPLARDRGVPVLAFSTDRNVSGNGVYLLSFQPQSEVQRIISFAMSRGHKRFAAMIPSNAYGDVVGQSFREAVAAGGGTVSDIERFNPSAGAVVDPAAAVAKSQFDAIFIAQGGALLRGIAPTLSYNGVDSTKVQFLGTGLWYDPANLKESLLSGGWFAAPLPRGQSAFDLRYHQTFGADPPQLASLAYDAVSLVALLANGQPYQRFTLAALTDPNGFAGVNGIFRFHLDGSIDRGLAVLAVEPQGFAVVSPPPTTFQVPGS